MTADESTKCRYCGKKFSDWLAGAKHFAEIHARDLMAKRGRRVDAP